ncbi:MAG TPA: glycosyltransferase [Ktedonobacteraceae bacterium]|nr:glycosyltransferase [Ktedonobacteraceae bacterium]
MMLRVSVVVPTYNRPTLLARCLEALLMQDFAPADYEIIIVDDADCAGTRQLVECRAQSARQSGYTICYIPVKSSHGPAAARNLGCRAARGEVIAFTDDDCIPCAGWLNEGVAAMVDGVVGVSGRIIVPLGTLPTDYEYNASKLADCEFVTANCFYRRDALLMVGGFDERFAVAWREDSDLLFTLEESGAKCASAPDAVVIHPVRPAQWGISIYQQRKSMFNALLYKKHPLLYRQKIQDAPPWRYYGIVSALLLVVISLIRRSGFLALPGLALWTYLTGQFCVQRLRHTSHAPRHIMEMMLTSIAIPPIAIFWRLRGAIKFRVFYI